MSLVLKPLRFLIFLLALFVSGQTLLGQTTSKLRITEDSLKLMFRQISRAVSDSQKLALNDTFRVLLRKTLQQEKAFSYPFDSLKALGKITSPDKRFRFCLWNIRMADGRFLFFGFIQKPGKENSTVIPLTDRSDSIADPEHQQLDPDHWYGALYYKIIPFLTERSDTAYTLLGWDGNNSVVTQKVIEVMMFGRDGKITFGAPLFKDYQQGQNTRIIFRYSAESSMILKLDEQQVITSKKWNPKKREFMTESRQASMIVCDRLVPLDPQLEGLYQHYVPASDIYDGFVLNNGKWLFIKGVDARNKH